jgi:hypothetical protein
MKIKIEVSKEIVEQIVAVQKEQLAKPARACVNSESAFVSEKLRNRGFVEAASIYWNIVCGCSGLVISDIEFLELEKKLKEIDRGFTMPAWGYSGT